MPFLNTVTLMGHITADPELRQAPSGESVAAFTVAVNSGGRDGQPRRGHFFLCETWGGWARNLAKTARKGCLVLVEGRLAQDRWIDAKTNQNRSRVKVVARRAFHVAAQYPEEPERAPGEPDEPSPFDEEEPAAEG
ncbi:MAG: single-stranded DNA-binding protein [Planctomycetes bacterium]|nr:single-stranded DNA-binding protein [Planctomycetota bacterium]